jgi:hypothetical protein
METTTNETPTWSYSYHITTLLDVMAKVDHFTLMRSPGLVKNPAARDAIVETIFGDKLELANRIACKAWALLHTGRYRWADLKTEWPEAHHALYDEVKGDYRSLAAAHAAAEWAGDLKEALYRKTGRMNALSAVR